MSVLEEKRDKPKVLKVHKYEDCILYLKTWFLTVQLKRALNSWSATKGQIISKRFFVVLNFFQKTNENTSHSGKNEFICSFLEEFMA